MTNYTQAIERAKETVKRMADNKRYETAAGYMMAWLDIFKEEYNSSDFEEICNLAYGIKSDKEVNHD